MQMQLLMLDLLQKLISLLIWQFDNIVLMLLHNVDMHPNEESISKMNKSNNSKVSKLKQPKTKAIENEIKTKNNTLNENKNSTSTSTSNLPPNDELHNNNFLSSKQSNI